MGTSVFTECSEGLKERGLGWATGMTPGRTQNWPQGCGELLSLRCPPAELDARPSCSLCFYWRKATEAEIQGLGSQTPERHCTPTSA